jgi:hypothetical protein
MEPNVTFQCPSGGDWYVCTYGTAFAGCCSVDPCLETCPAEYLHPIGFNPSDYGSFPDGSCGASANFYTCSAGKTFAGCCKSNPCMSGQCPKGDLTPVFLTRPEQFRYFGSVSGNTSALPPVQTAPVARISSAPAMSTYTPSGEKLGRREGLSSISVAVAVMTAISIAVALWLCYRKIGRRYRKQGRAPER